MLGKAAVAMWWDIPAEVRADWEEWHTYEHMPERLGIPGFLRGTRFINEGSYFVLYETAELANITSGPYLERLNNPTPWSRRMMPHHKNMVRGLFAVRAQYGTGLGGFVATVRFSGALPAQLPKSRGITSAAFLESQPMPGGPTAEQKIRGGDGTADKALIVCGYDRDTVKRAAEAPAIAGGALEVYGVSFSLNRS